MLKVGEGELPEVGVDHSYLGKDQQRTTPWLVAKDRPMQMLAGTLVEGKGRDHHSSSFMTAFIPGLGWKRLVQKSDNEPSLLALSAPVALNQVSTSCRRLLPEGDHAASGLEAAVRELKEQVRVIRCTGCTELRLLLISLIHDSQLVRAAQQRKTLASFRQRQEKEHLLASK